MRKGVPLVTLLFLLSFTPAQSANPPKPGANCSKQGVTKSFQGKKFTCIKSGKKLVWNKGISSATASSSKSPDLSAQPSPSPSPSTSSVNDQFTNFGKDASRFRAVEAHGLELIKGRKLNLGPIESKLESPNDREVIRMTENAQFAYSVYEQFMPLGYTPRWAVGGTQDWLKKNVFEMCPNLTAIQINSGAATCRMTAVWRDPNSSDPNTKNLMLVQGGHEIFHLYQQELWGRYWNVVPDWVREGSASLAMGIILTHFDDRKSFSNYGEAQRVERNPKDRATCEKALEKWEKNQIAEGFGNNNGCEYGLGMLMNEFLIMQGFTLKQNLDLVKIIGTGVDFPTAFQQVYKKTTAQFFSELRTYLKTLDYGW